MRSTTEPKPRHLTASLSFAIQKSPIAYGLGSFGLESLYNVFAGFYMFYYIDELGLAVAMASIINLVYAVWDAANDPLVGFLSDNTRTRWGRRRPWLLTALPFYLATLILVYAVPKPLLDGKGLFWYALVIFILFEGAYTILSVNYAALFPELFQGLRERARASSFYQGFSKFGELMGFSIPPFIYAKYGFVPMAISFTVVAGIALFLGILRNTEDPSSLKAPPLDLKGAFVEVFKDRSFLLFAIAVTFLMFTTGLYTMAIPFWVKYTLGASPQSTSLIFAIAFIVAILSVSIWSRFVRSHGIKRSWLWSVGVGVVATIIFGFSTNLTLAAIGAAFVGVSMGGIDVCRVIIMADFVDNDYKRTGHRREGIYYSLFHVMGKLSKLPQTLSLLLLTLFFGYISGENPGPQPENAFRFLMSIFPLVFTLTAWIVANKLSFESDQSSHPPGY